MKVGLVAAWLRKIRWSNLLLHQKLLMVYVPIILLPFAIGTFLISRNYNDFSQGILETYALDTLNLAVNNIESVAQSYEKLSVRFIADETITKLLSAKTDTQWESLTNMKLLSQQIKFLISDNDNSRYITAVLINYKNGLCVVGESPVGNYDVLDPHYMENVKAMKGYFLWSEPETYYFRKTNQQCMKLSRTIRGANMKDLGQLTLVINTGFIDHVFDKAKLSDSMLLKLMNADGKTIMERRGTGGAGAVPGEGPGNGAVPGDDSGAGAVPDPDSDTSPGAIAGATRGAILHNYLVKSESGKWTLSVSYRNDVIFRPLRQLTRNNSLLIAGFLLAGLFGIIIISVDFVLPVRKLVTSIRRGYRNIDSERLLKLKGPAEINEISMALSSMIHEINGLFKEIQEIEEKKRRADIRNLQSQISPHFLYNALNAIRWMAMIQKQENIKKFVDALNNLLTYSMRNTDKLTNLAEEVRITQDYILIQKVRYEDFEVQFSMDPAIEMAQIPRMILQPIIENALMHGIMPNGSYGRISVTGMIAGDRITLGVTDNGSGMTPEKLEEVRNIILQDQDEHIGLKNIHERIRMEFGAAYGLRVDSTLGAGTSVTIEMPFRMEKTP
jgi:two-component system, sensor histidine kinase YesM